MRVDAARTIARRWVIEQGKNWPGFRGAFTHGSSNWLAGDAEFPPVSDLDLRLVLDGSPSETTVPKGKLYVHDLLLDVSWVDAATLTAGQILGHYQIAPSFATAFILADPTGLLTPLVAEVAAAYPARQWVMVRCQDARQKALRDLRGVLTMPTLPQQVLAWLFGAGKVAQIPLVAGLQNPTVRRRYEAVRQLLETYGFAADHETLLAHIGCAGWSGGQARQHLEAMAALFDATVPFSHGQFAFASDISAVSRSSTLGGTRTMIENGDHREAAFWIAVTASRCMVLLDHEDQTIQTQHAPAYHRLLRDLGVPTIEALGQRAAQIEHTLPQVEAVAQAIIAANPSIIE